MTEIAFTLSGAYDRIVREDYMGYFPSKETNRLTDHDFEQDIKNTLIDQGYIWTLESDPYMYGEVNCVDLHFAHPEHHTDIKVTVYRTPVGDEYAVKHYFVRVTGNGRRARELWAELVRIENDVINGGD